ncbi:MAG: cupin domain-containing protein [Anaerolineales bacterium]|nr:cupin domain-containing protein [Anaerolineales bacterium]
MLIPKDSVKPIDFRGLIIHDYNAEVQTDSSLAVVDVPPQAGHPVAMSTRSEEKLYYVIEGSVCFDLEGVESTLNQGDGCVVKRKEEFSYRNESAEPARLILVHTPSFDMDCEAFFDDKDR